MNSLDKIDVVTPEIIKWEYFIHDTNIRERIVFTFTDLQRFGSEGWELVLKDGHQWIFKRLKSDA